MSLPVFTADGKKTSEKKSEHCAHMPRVAIAGLWFTGIVCHPLARMASTKSCVVLLSCDNNHWLCFTFKVNLPLMAPERHLCSYLRVVGVCGFVQPRLIRGKSIPLYLQTKSWFLIRKNLKKVIFFSCLTST